MSWLKDYIEYTNYQEAPEIFHTAVGLSVIASNIGRRVWLDRRSHGVTWYQVFPGSLMTTLVSPPGRGRKSTAIGLGRALMRQSGVKIVEAKSSSEKLILSCGAVKRAAVPTSPGGTATIIASELSDFLSKSTYAEMIVDFLTKIYDGEDEYVYQTMGGGEMVIPKPCITTLFGTTPIAMGKSVPEKAQMSGYLGRVLHVYHDGLEKDGNPLNDLDDEDISTEELANTVRLRNRLNAGLELIRGLGGGFRFAKSPDARAWHSNWRKSWDALSFGHIEGYAQRREDHMLRIAMILRISTFYEDPSKVYELGVEQLKAADTFLSFLEARMHKAFAYIGEAEGARLRDRILDAIKRSGGVIPQRALVKSVFRFFKDSEELKRTLQFLIDAGEIIHAGNVNGIDHWRVP